MLMTTAGVYAFPDSESVYDALRRSGKPVRWLGETIFGEEILCAETGGDALPAVLTTAGCHATETAGVIGALRLLVELKTRHKVYVVPLRDPFGFNDFSHCLSALLRRAVSVATYADAMRELRSGGRVVREERDLWLGLVGEYGVALLDTNDPLGYQVLFRRLKELLPSNAEAREALRGRRMFIPPLTPSIEATGLYGRTYTTVVDSTGEILSLSNYFGRDDAPNEVAYVQRLADEVRPGLTVDCHEDPASDGFYVPARTLPSDPAGSERIANAMIDAVQAAGLR